MAGSIYVCGFLKLTSLNKLIFGKFYIYKFDVIYIYIYICGFLKLASSSTLIFGRFFLKKKKKKTGCLE